MPADPLNVGIVWDAESRLTEVRQGPTTLASFSYDGLGRRAQKIAAGVTHTYVLDGDSLIEERESTGQTLRYVEGPAIDQHLAMQDAATVTYYVADHLGSVTQETNSAGAVTLARKYDPWGNMLAGASSSGWAFTGREWDSETELGYYRARHLDPKLGGFLSEDPVDFGDGLSLHSYVLGNPTNLVDPTGWVATGRMKCDSDCPPEVKDGGRDACVGGKSHPDAWVRRCMAKQCRGTTITCLAPDADACQIRSRRGNGSPAYAQPPSGILVCPSNPPPPWSCWKRVIIHEAAIHNCTPPAPQPGKFDHMMLSYYFIKTVKCP